MSRPAARCRAPRRTQTPPPGALGACGAAGRGSCRRRRSPAACSCGCAFQGLEPEAEETVTDPGDLGGDPGDQPGVVLGAQRRWQHTPGVGLDLDVVGYRVVAA